MAAFPAPRCSGAGESPGRAGRLLAALGTGVGPLVALTGCGAGLASAPAPTVKATACSSGTLPRTVAYTSLAPGPFTQAAASAGARAIRVGATTLAFRDFTPDNGTFDGGLLGSRAGSGWWTAPRPTTGFSGFTFERVSGTTTLIRPEASGNTYAMRIATDRESGKYVIVDPRLTDGHWTVTLPKRWYGTANRQKRSDVVLIIDGRERPDLLRFQIY